MIAQLRSADEKVGEDIDKAILTEGAKHVRDDTLTLVNPTEIRKEYGLHMEHITKVRDASTPHSACFAARFARGICSSKEGRDVIVHGYHGCMAVACQNGKRKTVPLALRLWSSGAPGHKGENDEVLKIVTEIMVATGGKGIIVYDRGISHDRRSPRSGALAWVRQARVLQGFRRQRLGFHRPHDGTHEAALGRTIYNGHMLQRDSEMLQFPLDERRRARIPSRVADKSEISIVNTL